MDPNQGQTDQPGQVPAGDAGQPQMPPAPEPTVPSAPPAGDAGIPPVPEAPKPEVPVQETPAGE